MLLSRLPQVIARLPRTKYVVFVVPASTSCDGLWSQATNGSGGQDLWVVAVLVLRSPGQFAMHSQPVDCQHKPQWAREESFAFCQPYEATVRVFKSLSAPAPFFSLLPRDTLSLLPLFHPCCKCFCDLPTNPPSKINHPFEKMMSQNFSTFKSK